MAWIRAFARHHELYDGITKGGPGENIVLNVSAVSAPEIGALIFLS